jgi:hypothetical protein
LRVQASTSLKVRLSLPVKVFCELVDFVLRSPVGLFVRMLARCCK